MQSRGPDRRRAVVHIDIDCFYAQCEELRNPTLQSVPMGVFQKFLIVTCNYTARAAGVTKMMSVKEATKRCPHLVLVSGEGEAP